MSKTLDSRKTTSFPPISDPAFPPPFEDPKMLPRPPLVPTNLPPLPPIPKIPPLPALPPLPPFLGRPNLPPMSGNAAVTKSGDDKLTKPKLFGPTPPLLPPNTVQTPSILPPAAFQPSLVTPLPPNSLQPPPSPLIPLPPNSLLPLPDPLPPLPSLTPPPTFPFSPSSP